MSTFWNTVVIVLIIAAIVFGVKSVMGTKTPAPAAQSTTTSQTVATQPDTSDAALNADMTSIDAQMNAVTSSSAQVDQSFNDTPVTQTE